MDESTGEERSEGNLFAYFRLSEYIICIFIFCCVLYS